MAKIAVCVLQYLSYDTDMNNICNDKVWTNYNHTCHISNYSITYVANVMLGQKKISEL